MIKEKKVLILVNEPINEMAIGRNSTLTLALALQQKGFNIFFAKELVLGSKISQILAQQISFKKEIFQIYDDYRTSVEKLSKQIENLLSSKAVIKIPSLKTHKLSEKKISFSLSEAKHISYNEFSFIFNRFDPIEDPAWIRDEINKMRIIEIAQKVKIIGQPENIDKYEPLALHQSDFIPETLIVEEKNLAQISEISAVKTLLKKYKKLVIKPAKSGQGKGVKQANSLAEIKAGTAEILSEFNGKVSGGIIVQEMLAGAMRGDIRTIFFYNSKTNKFELGGHVARMQLKGNFINCISSEQAVATKAENMLSTKELRDLNKNSKALLSYLNKNPENFKSPIIGADFIPKFFSKKEAENSQENTIYLGEINFHCVALFNMIDFLNKKSPFTTNSLTSKIVDGILSS
jgi:glutathione synthase/RimK-type ligase-like ATP-grasp enzyme